MLSLLFFIPIFGSFCSIFTSNEQRIKKIVLITSLVALSLSLIILIQFNGNFHEFQFIQEWSLIGFCHFHTGIDGLSLFFIILTTFIITISILASWNSIEKNIKSFLISFLILESLLIGVFIVLDLLLFYITFESCLIPMALIIGMFGSKDKVKAVFYFFLYTLSSSLFMLLSILFIISITGNSDFQSLALTQFSTNTQLIIWLGFFIAFAVKTPLIPFHIWLPKAHSNAPLAGSILLASILLKLAVYGFIRVCLPLLPDASLYFTPLVYTMAFISIIYSSLATLRQIDTKAIVAYSSIGHMGVVILGIFSNTLQGIEGAMLLSLAHGIVSPALFILVTLLYERHGTRILTYFRGQVTNMPIFTIFFFLFTIANCATPLTANFIGEFLCFIGSFQINPILTGLAGISMVLSASYSFWFFNRISYGTESSYLNNVYDLSRREFFVLLPLLFLTILLGLFPNIVLDTLHFSVSSLIIDSSSSFLNSPSVPSIIALFPSFFLLNSNDTSNPITPVKSYSNANIMKKEIFIDNKDKSGIYRWVNNVNGKSYIGSAVNLSKRLNEHYRGNRSNNILQQAINKYGLSNFSIEILKYCDESLLIEREQYYFDLFSPEYNINPVAGSRFGTKHSEESRKKISDGHLGKLASEETREKMSEAKRGDKNPNFSNPTNYQHSEETREKMSAIKGTTIFIHSLDNECLYTFTSSRATPTECFFLLP
jgi:NADH-ubiquinone oxidoreductase chain 4